MKSKQILIVCLLLGLGLLIYDYVSTQRSFESSLERAEAGAGSKSETLNAYFEEDKAEMEIDISERALSEKQQEEKFEAAIEEINATYLGQNKNANQVYYDLNLKSSYVDGLISAYWKFDKYGFIQSDGKLVEEEIPSGGEVINITCEMRYEDVTRLYSFSVLVCQKSLDTYDGRVSAIQNEVRQTDENTRLKRKLKLPSKVQGMDVTWRRKMNFRGLQVMFLGILTVAALEYGKRRDERKAKLQEIAEKEKDYPMIVSELSILMSAGMSFRKALERMAGRYNQKKKTGVFRPGYEEILYTYRKINDGAGELQAIEDLGRRSDSKEYRKLSMLLLQNLKKGSKDLLDSLEKEEKYAFELRKQRAIKAGEEASTKLLVPMSGMLFIVIVILVVPAVMQMNI